MIYKGKEFEADVKKLKQLSAKRKRNGKKYKAEFLEHQKSLIKKYDVNLRTVQNWNKERAPWLRDMRSDAGKERVKVSKKAKEMLKDAVDSGQSKQDAAKIVAEASGEKISTRKVNNILTEDNKIDNPMFGAEFKTFLNEHFKLDLIPPSKGIKLSFKNNSYKLSKQDIADILLVLTNSYNRCVYALEHRLPIDRNYLRRARTWHLFEQLLDMAIVRNDQKTFNSLTLAVQRLELDPSKYTNPDWELMEAVCKKIDPTITFERILSIAEAIDNEE